MPKFPVLRSRYLIKALLRVGYYIDHQTGSHVIMYKNDISLPITIPNHNKDLKIGTLKNILKTAEITIEELLEIL